jgi:hypothetical protein
MSVTLSAASDPPAAIIAASSLSPRHLHTVELERLRKKLESASMKRSAACRYLSAAQGRSVRLDLPSEPVNDLGLVPPANVRC